MGRPRPRNGETEEEALEEGVLDELSYMHSRMGCTPPMTPEEEREAFSRMAALRESVLEPLIGTDWGVLRTYQFYRSLHASEEHINTIRKTLLCEDDLGRIREALGSIIVRAEPLAGALAASLEQRVTAYCSHGEGQPPDTKRVGRLAGILQEMPMSDDGISQVYTSLDALADELSRSTSPREFALQNVVPPHELEAAMRESARNREELRKARHAVLLANTRLVLSVARKYDRHRNSLADLTMEGIIGLNRAVEKFTLDRGTKFSTYATWWIRQSIVRWFHEKQRIIRTPSHLRPVQRAIQEFRGRYAETHPGRRPDNATIEEELGLKEGLLNAARQADKAVDSLNAPYAGGERQKIDVLEDGATSEEDVADDLMRRELHLALVQYFPLLDPREREVLNLRFGLGLRDPHDPGAGIDMERYGTVLNLTEVGKLFGLTRERVRQIESSALRKIRGRADRKDSMLASYRMEGAPPAATLLTLAKGDSRLMQSLDPLLSDGDASAILLDLKIRTVKDLANAMKHAPDKLQSVLGERMACVRDALRTINIIEPETNGTHRRKR